MEEDIFWESIMEYHNGLFREFKFDKEAVTGEKNLDILPIWTYVYINNKNDSYFLMNWKIINNYNSLWYTLLINDNYYIIGKKSVTKWEVWSKEKFKLKYDLDFINKKKWDYVTYSFINNKLNFLWIDRWNLFSNKKYLWR